MNMEKVAKKLIDDFNDLRALLCERWAIWADVYYGDRKYPPSSTPETILIENGHFELNDEQYYCGQSEYFTMQIYPSDLNMTAGEYRHRIEADKAAYEQSLIQIEANKKAMREAEEKEARRIQFEKLKNEFDNA